MPPESDADTVPVVELGQAAALGVVVSVMAEGCVIFTVLVVEHPFSSVAVTVDKPAGSVETEGPVAPLLQL